VGIVFRGSLKFPVTSGSDCFAPGSFKTRQLECLKLIFLFDVNLIIRDYYLNTGGGYLRSSVHLSFRPFFFQIQAQRQRTTTPPSLHFRLPHSTKIHPRFHKSAELPFELFITSSSGTRRIDTSSLPQHALINHLFCWTEGQRHQALLYNDQTSHYQLFRCCQPYCSLNPSCTSCLLSQLSNLLELGQNAKSET
jgi:hypothetical protein